jgi:hypothetical protein
LKETSRVGRLPARPVGRKLPDAMLTGRLRQRSLHARGAAPFVVALLAGAGSIGCGADPNGGGSTNTDHVDGQVTWNQDVAPFVTKKCVMCHQPGGIAPMSLADYATAYKFAGKMLAQVEAGTMPPWGARTTDECTPAFDFRDDPRLTSGEQALLSSWLDTGAVEGPPRATPLPKPASTALVNPDLHLTIPSAVQITGTSDRFVCFVLDPGNSKDKYIKAVQVNPGNSAVVHHVLIFADSKGEASKLADANGQYDCFGGPQLTAPVQLLGAWAPGGVPAVMPEDVGIQLTGGTKIVIQVHYHPTRVNAETDASTSVDLQFTDDTPRIPGLLALIGNFKEANFDKAGGVGYGLMPGPDDPATGPKFEIPPNVTAHTETQRFLVQQPGADSDFAKLGAKAFRLFGVGTHMHYVGRDMKIEVEHADGRKECLLETPAWDFNWQRLYYYDTPLASAPAIRPGDVLTMRCSYDNSMANPFVRTALDQQGISVPIDVQLGETTLDEMCLGAFGIALE